VRKTYKSYYPRFITVNCVAILFCLLSSSNSFASNKDSLLFIKGTVIDSNTHQSMPFEGVQLVIGTSGIIAECYTDIDGKFEFTGIGQYDKNMLSLKIIGFAHKTKIIKDICNGIVIKVDQYSSDPLMKVTIACPAPIFDRTGHLNTTIRKGDTPYW